MGRGCLILVLILLLILAIVLMTRPGGCLAPQPTPTPPPVKPTVAPGPLVIGRSVKGRDIVAYPFGNGPVKLALVGALHGGYEWNTAELANRAIQYFRANPRDVPGHVTLFVIPAANPDGLAAGRDLGARPNANGVDLNRNWDCGWKTSAVWRDQPINPGKSAFSEPESRVLRDFLLSQRVRAVIFYHSQAAEVYAGGRCGDNRASVELARRVAAVTGYSYDPGGVGYEVSGDAIDYLNGQGIAAIEVELTNHNDVEWERNLKGIRAMFEMFR